MAKFKPGIPDSFTLDVAPVSDLGAYLEEPNPLPQRKPRPHVAEEGKGTAVPRQVQAETIAPAVERPVISTAPPQAPDREPVVERPTISAPPPQAARPVPVVEAPPIVLRE